MSRTIGDLVSSYRTDPDSWRYRRLSYKVRVDRDRYLARIEREYGRCLLENIDSRTIRTWYNQWIDGGKLAIGKAFIGQLRALFSYGFAWLEDKDCQRLYEIAKRKRLKSGQPRTAKMTAAHVYAIRATAKEVGLFSIALAQAFQFELLMRQKDVIGEWTPKIEAKRAYLESQRFGVWNDGICWEEIDEHFILRHPTTARERDVEADLKQAPMVLTELAKLAELYTDKPRSEMSRSDFPASGPVVVFEGTGLPWEGELFRSKWRAIANLAGVPRSVKNMDSRAGAKMVRIIGRDFRAFERPRAGHLGRKLVRRPPYLSF